MKAQTYFTGTTTLILSCLFMLQNVFAEDHPIPNEYVYCTVCHGTLFGGNSATAAPKLTGLSAWYIESQLRAFKDGLRGTHGEDLAGLEMRPMAEMLSEKILSHVSQLVATLPNKNQRDNPGKITERGQQLYAGCSACHGADGRGNQQYAAPNLVTQNSWYLTTQINNYRNKLRGTLDRDIPGRQMRTATSVLNNEQDVIDVVAFIKSMQ
jgi:cbb3-type cytochrome c oxidase subunit III